MSIDTSCLYSTVKNTSGVAKIFGFLPPHGRTLGVDEEFTFFGDIRQGLGGNQGPERSVQRRLHSAFEAAIESGDLEIVSTPNPIFQDVDSGATKMLQLDDDAFVAVDPCWKASEENSEG
jgi:hypothetical protein